MNRGTGRIVPGIKQSVQAESGGDLRHLLVGPCHVDHPGIARTDSEHPALPAQTLYAVLNQRLAPGQVDRRFEEEGVARLRPPLPEATHQLFLSLRVEIEHGDHVRNLGEGEGVVRVVAHPVQVIDVVVGAVVALGGPVGQPAAACRVKIRHEIDHPPGIPVLSRLVRVSRPRQNRRWSRKQPSGNGGDSPRRKKPIAVRSVKMLECPHHIRPPLFHAHLRISPSPISLPRFLQGDERLDEWKYASWRKIENGLESVKDCRTGYTTADSTPRYAGRTGTAQRALPLEKEEHRM